MKNKLLYFVATIYCTAMLLVNGQDQHTEIEEHTLYENIWQPDRSIKYYQYKIQNENYHGKEHLTFKVMADIFDSDPDIYISKSKNNQYPSSSENSDWYCERKGSETCIIQKGDFAIGETLYFGISCTRACGYKLRVWFTPTVDLSTTNRWQRRFEAYSTTILKYEVPDTVLEEVTKSVEIYVQPEHRYTQVDLFLSLDSSFYLIEETPAAHVSSTGTAIKFTDKDYKWCRNCPIYAIINVYEEDRYYITSVGRVENDELSNVIPTDIFVNPFEQQCYPYFVERTKFQVRYGIEGYAGHADAYLAAKTKPSGPGSGTIDMRAAHGANRAMVLSVGAKKDYGQTAGTYYLCFYAYTPFSARITMSEAEIDPYFEAIDNQVTTVWLDGYDYMISRYQNSGFNTDGVITIMVDGQDLGTDQYPPIVEYTVCANSDPTQCTLTEEDLNGGNMCSLDAGVGRDCGAWDLEVTKGSGIKGKVAHSAAGCGSGCTYMVVVKNSDGTPRAVSLLIQATFNDPGDVELDKQYKNIIRAGQYVPHEINPATNPKIQPFINSLTITLHSLVGDADLFVSTTQANPTNDNYMWRSRLMEPLDQVTIRAFENGDIDFSKSFYFSVYGNTYSEVLITFTYGYAPSFDEQLEKALPIGDGKFIFTNIPDEYGERLYSFAPWWSGKENRTSVFLADVLINKVFFYARWNAYPKHFYTSQHDFNDTIAIYGASPDAHHNGTYYVRLRPDFALYDLLSARQYIFNMYTFSQTPATLGEGPALAYENIQIGETYVGFSNGTRYQDYRYMQIDMEATYRIAVKRIPGQGTPQFYVSIVDHGYFNEAGEPDDGEAPRRDSYGFIGEPTAGKIASRSHLVLTGPERSGRSPRCATVRHSAQGDNKQACFVAISVRCKGLKQCAYELSIQMEDVDASRKQFSYAGTRFLAKPPGTILADDYTNGYVSEGFEVKYYYFPIDPKTMHDGAIIVNKTQIYGTGENGDVRVLVNIIADVDDASLGAAKYQNWVYPTDESRGVVSSSGADKPEVIEVCREKLEETCKDKVGCALLVGVVGQADKLASYRLKGFYGENKLNIDDPRNISVETQRIQGDHFDYYWFVINEAALYEGSRSVFQYQVSVSSPDGSGDPDLYVSLMDGRFPTENDFDLVSAKTGADSVRIERYSNSTLWDRRGWDPKAGVVVVVGVRVNKPMKYTVVLTQPPTDPKSPLLTMKRLFVGAAQQRVELHAEKSKGYSQIYQYYNWFHRHFEITFSFLEGRKNATIMYQKAGQEFVDNNIYTGIPLTVNNSEGAYNVSQGKYRVITVDGSNCYSCWYFIRIDIDDDVPTRYDFSIADNVDTSGQFLTIQPGRTSQVNVRGKFLQRRKFVLSSMANWILNAVVATGDIEIYVGLDPETVDKGGHLWSGSTVTGRDIRIAVKTTDSNFHLAAYYYVHIKSTSSNDAVIKLTLTQERQVQFVGNNHDYTYSLKHPIFEGWTMQQKFRYLTVQEQVKLHVFRVPPGDGATSYHKVQIKLEQITPSFYPKIFLLKVELDSEPSNIANLNYPDLVTYDIVYGENPFYQLDSSEFVYEFVGEASRKHVYYTMSVYQHTWALTSFRKSVYQLSVQTDVSTKEAFDTQVLPEPSPVSLSQS